jgi:hypothetical protein
VVLVLVLVLVLVRLLVLVLLRPLVLVVDCLGARVHVLVPGSVLLPAPRPHGNRSEFGFSGAP